MLTHALTPAQLPGPEVGAGVVEVGTLVVGGGVVGAVVGAVVGVVGTVVGGALVEGTLVGGVLEGGGAGTAEPLLRTLLIAAS